jgi:hypothetical protein
VASQITWTREQRAKAKELGKALFAVGIDDCHLPKPVGKHGKWLSTFCLDNELAVKAWAFANDLYRGFTPQAAFDKNFSDSKTVKDTAA